MPRGPNVFVVGPIELARVALFRAAAGFWRGVEGDVVRPSFDELLFLPQRPYLPPGTLRDVVLRTDQAERKSDEQIRSVLQDLELEHVLTRAGGLDVEHDWSTFLSLGDQQKLAVARVTLARPAYALLDRLGTSLSPAEIRRVFDRLRRDGITFVAFAETPDDEALCELVLELNADGTWRTRPGESSAKKA
jgi:putative ATP-binding cassette transporter